MFLHANNLRVCTGVHLCESTVCVLSESCSREEFMCDSGRCLLPVSVCDGHPNCHDQTDEANCSHKHKGDSTQIRFKKIHHYTIVIPEPFHRMRWTEDRAIWVPVKSKPPWELSSPAGANFFAPANLPNPQLQKTNFMFSISCAFGIYPSRRVTSSHSASGTSAWRLRMCVSLITWRFMTVLTLELDECWGGETFGLKYRRAFV